jgi:hypothetical protein
MNQVIRSVRVTNPLGGDAHMTTLTAQPQHVPQLNKQQEMQNIGSFKLEEGIQMYMEATGVNRTKGGFTLSDLQDLNVNFNQIMRDNNVPRIGPQQHMGQPGYR